MMVGLMLVAASKRKLIMADGMPACAALMVASHIAPAVTDYCVFCRSHGHHGLDQALALFHSSALLELGMQSIDGTGASLAFPLVRSAALALLTEVAEGGDAGPTLPEPDLEPAQDDADEGDARSSAPSATRGRDLSASSVSRAEAAARLAAPAVHLRRRIHHHHPALCAAPPLVAPATAARLPAQPRGPATRRWQRHLDWDHRTRRRRAPAFDSWNGARQGAR